MEENFLHTEEEHLPALSECKNCSARLDDHAYCPVCGQKSDTHVFTVKELLEEIADGLFNLDSRIWRSLVPLALHPGKLTLEYLRGRRMYYLPPFRLYLILSVLFFLVPSNNGNLGDEFAQDFSQEFTADSSELEPEDLSALTQDLEADTEGAALARQIREEVARDLAAAREENPESFRDSDRERCGIPGTSLLSILLRDACLKFMNDPQGLTQQIFDMVPVMMIAGIPLIALFMFLVYMFSGRKYVEHIIFLLHSHAFFFLLSILMTLASTLGKRYATLYNAMDWFWTIAAWYIPIYIFVAMLRVYGDGLWKTFFKGCFVMFGYLTSIIIVTIFGILYTALGA